MLGDFRSHKSDPADVPGLYFAGTLTQSRDFKKHTSAFIHGFRYGIRALVHMLDQKYHGIEWPHRMVPAEALADAVLARINRTSALFQQFGFLSDVFTPDGRYYEEMPLDYVPFDDCFTVSLEVPADRLLVIAPDAGWEPSCEFLRVPVPDEPYPHLNDPEKFWARVAARVSETQ